MEEQKFTLISKEKMETKKMIRRAGLKDGFHKSKRANMTVDPLLTNPLNSCTKLQIHAT